MTINMNKEVFSTTDLCLATTLSLFIPIVSIDKADPRRSYFIFDDPKTNQLVEDYWQQKIQVFPQIFFTQLKNLKTRIYQ